MLVHKKTLTVDLCQINQPALARALAAIVSALAAQAS
jgi:hypothetical protein